MIMTREEAKVAMRDLMADDNEVDDLIQGAEDAIEAYIRYPLSELPEIPAAIKNAAKYYIAANHEMSLPDTWLKSFYALLHPYRDMPV